MNHFPRQKDIARSVRIFENDGSWYQSYWYDAPEPESPVFSVHVVVWTAVFVVGILISI